ncbi:ORF1 [Potexvirus sp.]|uniref:ORF1 n=1 Tax=Potexvirus sp. TaxID=2283800 RepID=UPI000E102FCE|nr:ORF1 [Potexvirus sp.]AXG65485.1 ORF1 [Potexvirus sp.]
MARVREVMSALTDPSLKAVIQEEAYKSIKLSLEATKHTNPFAQTNESADVLENLGIMTNPLAVLPHTHAADKALENDMYDVVSNYFDRSEPITFYYMKPGKLGRFRRGPQQRNYFINTIFEPKDVVRYPEATIYKSFHDQPCTTEKAFMGDTLHYWDPDHLAQLFMNSPKLNQLYATMVLPAEAYYKIDSLYPQIYTLKYVKEHFMYLPGGHAGGAYCHHRRQLGWLRIGKISRFGGRLTLTLQILESKAAHHLFLITRGDLQTPLYRTFTQSTPYVLLPRIFLPARYNCRTPIPLELASKMFMYCKSLGEVKMRDLYAKLRQMLPSKELVKYRGDDLVFITNYFYLISRLDSMTCFDQILSGNLLQKALRPVRAWFQEVAMKIFGRHEFTQLVEALQWTPIDLTFEVTIDQPSDWFTNMLNSTFGPPLPNELNPSPKTPPGFETEDPTTEAANLFEAWDRINKIHGPPAPTTFPEEGTTTVMQEDTPSETHAEPAAPKELDAEATAAVQDDDEERPKPSWASEVSEEIPVQVQPEGTPASLPIKVSKPYPTEVYNAVHQLVMDTLPMPDKLKGRRAGLFSRNSKVKEYSYGKIKHVSSPWRDSLDQIGKMLDLDLSSFDHCLVQFFEDQALIPPHADNESLIQKHSRILTVSLGSALLTIQPRLSSSNAPPVSIPLEGCTVYVMEETCQDDFLHGIKALESGRLSLTFRRSVHFEKESFDHSLPWAAWIPILRSLGFRGNERQINPGDQSLIMPISEINNGLPKASCPTKEWTELLSRLHRLPVPFHPSLERAKAFGSDIKNCRIGKLLTHQPEVWRNAFGRRTEEQPRELALSLIHGAGGSGKSYAIQDFLRAHPDINVTIILPTNELRLDWVSKLPATPLANIKTYEKALLSNVHEVVILDDYGKLPAGFVEALVCVSPALKLIIATGDSQQSVHHESNENSSIYKLPPLIQIVQPLCRYYINATHRNRKQLANMLGVYSENVGDFRITHGTSPIQGVHLLVPSIFKKTAFAEMGHKVSTYSGCQGITAERVQILLDQDTHLCTKQVLYTALSRAVHSIHFIDTGTKLNSFWEKLDATPYLKTFLRTIREEKLKEMEVVEPEIAEPAPPNTHFPVENSKNFFDNVTENMGEKFEREIFKADTGFSNCVQTEDQLVQMFAHQQAKDETLFWATIEARLTITNPKVNFTEFYNKKKIGEILFENYKRAMQLPNDPVAFSRELWDVCADEVQKTYLSKPLHMIKNGQNRQSPDYPKNFITLFLKSQWVQKLEKLGLPKIKPGQTIASFHQITVMLYGTMARYLRRTRETFQPANIFINCERTPEDMSKWVREHWNFTRTSYANDFTAFDQSQDGAMLQFEIMKARFFNIPEEVIEGYIDIKCNAEVFTGVLSIMRLTGEGPTFDANTECNIAFTHTKYNIPKECAQLFAGDDSALDFSPEVKPSFRLIETELSLTAKPVLKMQIQGQWAEFCGMLITPLGVVKDPIKLWASWVRARQTGKLKEVADSYELDLCLAYQHRDLLQEVFDERQSEAHFNTVREIILYTKGRRLATYNG